MKRENIKLIIGIIIGVLFTSVTVYAITVKSNNVTFTPDDETWEVESVEDALNDLNEMANKANIYYLGSGNSFNIKTLVENGKLPESVDYTKLTSSNFIVTISRVNSGGTSTANLAGDKGEESRAETGVYAASISPNYNPATGDLTFSSSFRVSARIVIMSGGIGEKSAYGYVSMNMGAYLVLGDIGTV